MVEAVDKSKKNKPDSKSNDATATTAGGDGNSAAVTWDPRLLGLIQWGWSEDPYGRPTMQGN